jgi:hypothetical protein
MLTPYADHGNARRPGYKTRLPWMRALQVYAGASAQVRLRESGLKPADVRVIPAAAGGPKGLVLTPLDRFIFGHWLRGSAQVVHVIGASIGAWRMAAACLPDTDAAIRQLVDDYVTQSYPHLPGRQPLPRDISHIFGAMLDNRLGAHADDILTHPQLRLHVVTSRGRHILRREGRLATPLGYAGAFAANLINRPAMAGFLERVVFSDPRDALPFPLTDYRTVTVALSPQNLSASILASCSIPFWLQAVQDIPGAPPGAYWDGGITDYHLHLDYQQMRDGIVLYPHFQSTVVPGWLDKALTFRHAATRRLDPVVLLAPNPEWVKAVMPNGKLPDRGDFKAYGEAGVAARQRDWRKAAAEGERLVDEFAELVQRGSIEALRLV